MPEGSGTMFKKKKEENPLEGLHGQELIDAIKGIDCVRHLTQEQQRAFEVSQAEKERKQKNVRTFFSRLDTM